MKAWGWKLMLPLSMFLITVSLTVLADRIYGHFLMQRTVSLVHPSNTKTRYHSSEFSLTMRINNLGFRGPDVDIFKQKKRLVLIGDSFTLGWGVEGDKTWAARLQREFPELEILNLGKSGSHPGDHVKLMRTVVPLLKPDFVIEAILQGNDMNQLMGQIAYERGQRISPIAPTVYSLKVIDEIKTSNVSKAQRLARRIFPAFHQRFGREVDASDRWLPEALLLRESFRGNIEERFCALDEDVRNTFEQGMLSSWVLFESMYYPRAVHHAADTANALLKEAITRLSHYLMQMQEICAESGTKLIVVSLPNRPYGCPDCVPDMLRLGFDAEGSDTLDGDAAVRWAMDAAGVTALPKIPAMPRDCFYPLDGHWNSNGHYRFATSVASHLKSAMSAEQLRE